MCDATSIAMVAIGAGLGAKQAHDQRKAIKETEKVQQEEARKLEEARLRKGPDTTTRTDTAAADDEKRRRLALLNRNNVLTSVRGAFGVPNTASTMLSGQNLRTTLG